VRKVRQQRGLVGGQVDVGTVEAFGLVASRQAEEDHRDAGACRQSHGLGGQLVVVARGGDPEAGGELDLHAVGRGRAQLVEGDVEAGRGHLRAAGALVARRAGELADDRDGLAGSSQFIVLPGIGARSQV
jgi:hypothetical protein